MISYNQCHCYYHPVCVCVLSCFSRVRLFAILWTFRLCSLPGSCVHRILQGEYWSGFPPRSPRDLPNPGIKHMSLTSPALAGRFFTTSATGEALSPSCQLSTHRVFTVISALADAAQPRYHTYFHCESYEVSVYYIARTTVLGSLNKSLHSHVLLITCILKRML